jgi:hypothetical protein
MHIKWEIFNKNRSNDHPNEKHTETLGTQIINTFCLGMKL